MNEKRGAVLAFGSMSYAAWAWLEAHGTTKLEEHLLDLPATLQVVRRIEAPAGVNYVISPLAGIDESGYCVMYADSLDLMLHHIQWRAKAE